MNWATGILRLGFVAAVCWLAMMPLETNPSLFNQTRSHIAAGATSYSWEEANLAPDHILLPPDLFVSRMAQIELLAASATIGVLLCLGIAGWVVSGFRRA